MHSKKLKIKKVAFPRLRFKDLFKTEISILVERRLDQGYGFGGLQTKLGFNLRKSRFFHKKGSQQAERHELHTWETPVIKSITLKSHEYLNKYIIVHVVPVVITWTFIPHLFKIDFPFNISK